VSVLVAEADGELQGYVGCGTNRDHDAPAEAGEVRSMFVATNAWRRGVGRALMDAALDDLRERGYTTAVVWSFAANDRANAFYERMGFRRDGGERSNEAWAHTPEIRYRRSL
jgi:GNAT superfamily N-acetyltransferase